MVLAAIALTAIADATGTTVQESEIAGQPAQIECCSLDSPSSSSHLYLPRQTSGSCTQYSAKRTGNTHRYTPDFAKAGNYTHAGTCSFIKKETLNIRYLVVGPACKLISLGKLII